MGRFKKDVAQGLEGTPVDYTGKGVRLDVLQYVCYSNTVMFTSGGRGMEVGWESPLYVQVWNIQDFQSSREGGERLGRSHMGNKTNRKVIALGTPDVIEK